MAVCCTRLDETKCTNACQFTAIRKYFSLISDYSFENLKDITIQNTDLTELPQCFSFHLKNAESLVLSGNGLETLPHCLKGFENLKYLDVSRNKIKDLPSDIECVTLLQTLNLAENFLVNIPSTVCSLSHLQNLNVSSNQLKLISSDIEYLKNLIIFDLSNNSLEDVPKSIGNLSKLTFLNLSRNNLNKLPESLGRALNLRVLNLSYNKFGEFPNCLLSGLSSITVLDLSHNTLTNIDRQPKCANMLRTLDISNNKLSGIPNWLLQDICRNLTDLNISHNNEIQGVQLETGMFCTSKLEKLDLSDCSLIPATTNFLKSMVNLKQLRLGNDDKAHLSKTRCKFRNNFMEFPVDILSPCVNLQKLYLPFVGLTNIPFSVNRLTHNLEVFDISYNEISWLPDSFCDFCNLTTLILSNNTLISLPTNIGQLRELCYLSVDGNLLQSLPESMKFLEKLKYLDLYDNEFECVPEVALLIPSLEAVDIELNCFDTSNLSKQEMEFFKRYQSMKEELRSQLKRNLSVIRADDFKESCNYEREENKNFVSNFKENVEDSDENKFEEDVKGDNYTHILPETREDGCYTSEHEEEEDWNYVDDPSNYFDPNVSFEKQLPRHPWDLAKYIHDTIESGFCPGDQHAPCIRRHSIILQRPQDGQFDDADI